MSSGYNHTCASISNSAQCWGSCGNRVCDVPAELKSGAIAIATGYQHSCMSNNSLAKCWGVNN